MADRSPSIEVTEEAVRIEFPGPQTLGVLIGLLMLLVLTPFLYWMFVHWWPPENRKFPQLFFCVYLPIFIFRFWQSHRSHSIILSPKGLMVRQQAWGLGP